VIREERDGEGAVLVLSGELDFATAGHLRTVIQSGAAPARFDVTNLSFCDSSGLSCFFLSRQLTGGCQLIGANSVLRRMMEVAGATGLIEMR
jgi:anti-anti-sigma factor